MGQECCVSSLLCARQQCNCTFSRKRKIMLKLFAFKKGVAPNWVSVQLNCTGYLACFLKQQWVRSAAYPLLLVRDKMQLRLFKEKKKTFQKLLKTISFQLNMLQEVYFLLKDNGSGALLFCNKSVFCGVKEATMQLRPFKEKKNISSRNFCLF